MVHGDFSNVFRTIQCVEATTAIMTLVTKTNMTVDHPTLPRDHGIHHQVHQYPTHINTLLLLLALILLRPIRLLKPENLIRRLHLGITMAIGVIILIHPISCPRHRPVVFDPEVPFGRLRPLCKITGVARSTIATRIFVTTNRHLTTIATRIIHNMHVTQ